MRRKILIIDDEKDFSFFVKANLQLISNYEVIVTTRGKKGIKAASKERPDLILLDMIMGPGINGRETYERIIEIHPDQKAIIVSGFAETDEVREAQKLGAGQYIKKPLTLVWYTDSI